MVDRQLISPGPTLKVPEIGLGTVQFGLNYGISNTTGKPGISEVEKILELAFSRGIRYIDTAANYGDSESVIGALSSSISDAHIISKVPQLPKELAMEDVRTWIVEKFQSSCERLRVRRLYGLLLHNAYDLIGERGKAVFEALYKLQEEKKVSKIGASVYTRDQVECILDKFPVNLLQVPCNILDQQLIKDGYLSKLARNEIEVHVRSLFLQGLLLMDPSTLPPFFKDAQASLRAFRATCSKLGCSPLFACIQFGKQIQGANVLITGVTKRAELSEICEAYDAPKIALPFEEWRLDNSDICNPSKWPNFRQ